MEKITGPIRIVITGPESSGKTTLATELSEYYKAPLIKEYAREYLRDRDGDYQKEDLLEIARGQYHRQQSYLNSKEPLIISDTGLLVMKIWSKYKYNEVHPWIETHLKDYAVYYLLCKPDLPWVEDPLRENPNNRDFLFNLYHEELKNMEASYTIIEGDHRLEKAKQALETFLS